MAAHLKSKKHKQALEEVRLAEQQRDDGMDDDDDAEGGGAAGGGAGFYMERNEATLEEKLQMLKDGGPAIEKAPKPFKDWANRSLLAAKANGDDRLVQAVFREIVEELLVCQKKGSISYQNWARREDATGDMFKNEAPLDVKIPLVSPPNRDPSVQPSNERVCGSTRGLGAAAGAAGSRRRPGNATGSLQSWFTTAAGDECATRSPPVSADEVGVDDPLVARQRRGSTPSRPLSATIPASAEPTGDDAGSGVVAASADAAAALKAFVPELPGYRPEPGELDLGQVPVRRRTSGFRPRGSRAAGAIFAACAGEDEEQRRRTAVLYDRDFGRSGAADGPAAAVPGSRVGPAAGANAVSSMPHLRKQLRARGNEMASGSYVYAEFVPKVNTLIEQLEGASTTCTTTLMEAHELLVEVTVVEDQFQDAVLPCRTLMTVYHTVAGTAPTPRRDEFTAFFVMLLLIEQRPLTREQLKSVGKFRDPKNALASPAAQLAHLLPPAQSRGIMTAHALSVLSVVLNGEYWNFFHLYKRSVGIDASDGRLQILMDALADVVRSEALFAIYSATSFPAVFPLDEVMRRLNWHDETAGAYNVDEARDLVQRLGMAIVETKTEDGGEPPAACAHLVVRCYDADETPRRRLTAAFGSVNRALFRGAGRM